MFELKNDVWRHREPRKSNRVRVGTLVAVLARKGWPIGTVVETLTQIRGNGFQNPYVMVLMEDGRTIKVQAHRVSPLPRD
jgi:hypothetical protein